MSPKTNFPYFPAVCSLLVAGGIALAGCASTPAPEAALTGARVAIADAERADAGRTAPEPLTMARMKLSQADSSVKDKKMVEAERLANEARSDAELASARAGAVKAQTANMDIAKSNNNLQSEMDRNANSGVTQ
jgi:Domain of unknown function (DUF4398)